MRVIVLILSARQQIYSNLEKTIRNTWAKKSTDEVDFYYYYAGSDKFEVVEDKIICPFIESIENIGYKTINSFEFLNNLDFDYIFRTNSSSYVDIKKMLKFLEDKPKENFYCGRVNVEKKTKIVFGSGSGYFLSKDLVDLVVKNQNHWKHELIDDVALGQLLSQLNIKLIPSPRLDIYDLQNNNLFGLSKDSNSATRKICFEELNSNFHFRCKSIDPIRQKDSQIMVYLNEYFNSVDNHV